MKESRTVWVRRYGRVGTGERVRASGDERSAHDVPPVDDGWSAARAAATTAHG
jgi:hypothetical protein